MTADDYEDDEDKAVGPAAAKQPLSAAKDTVGKLAEKASNVAGVSACLTPLTVLPTCNWHITLPIVGCESLACCCLRLNQLAVSGILCQPQRLVQDFYTYLIHTWASHHYI